MPLFYIENFRIFLFGPWRNYATHNVNISGKTWHLGEQFIAGDAKWTIDLSTIQSRLTPKLKTEHLIKHVMGQGLSRSHLCGLSEPVNISLARQGSMGSSVVRVSSSHVRQYIKRDPWTSQISWHRVSQQLVTSLKIAWTRISQVSHLLRDFRG